MYWCGGLFIYRTVHVKRVGKSYAEQKLVEEQQFLRHCLRIVLQDGNGQRQNNYYYQQRAHWMFRSSAQESVVLW